MSASDTEQPASSIVQICAETARRLVSQHVCQVLQQRQERQGGDAAEEKQVDDLKLFLLAATPQHIAHEHT